MSDQLWGGPEYPEADIIYAVREGGAVERCHTIPHTRPYTVAAHSWGVAVLLHQIFSGHPRYYEALELALFHDVPERWTGDLPAPIKHNNKEVSNAIMNVDQAVAQWLDIPSEHEASEDAFYIFKLCDLLELYLWAQEEMAMGNQNALSVHHQLQAWFAEMERKHELPSMFYTYVKTLDWRRASDQEVMNRCK